MPMVIHTAKSKLRHLLTGQSGTGKTTSLPTFLFGAFDYTDPAQKADAESYADGRSMVILSCPGENGNRSLPEHDFITCYSFEEDVDAVCDYAYSASVLHDFDACLNGVFKNKPDILALDGFQGLYNHMMNYVSNGDYLQGKDLGSKRNQYEKAAIASRAAIKGESYITRLYNSPVPLLVVTTGERYTARGSEFAVSGNIDETRFLYPGLPGQFSTTIIHKFDTRLSCQIHDVCMHPQCEYTKKHIDHYVWQFIDRGDVRGVKINGVRKEVSDQFRTKPYMHPNYATLEAFMNKYSK